MHFAAGREPLYTKYTITPHRDAQKRNENTIHYTLYLNTPYTVDRVTETHTLRAAPAHMFVHRNLLDRDRAQVARCTRDAPSEGHLAGRTLVLARGMAHAGRRARVELEVFVVAKSVALELFLSGDLCAANRNTILLERPGAYAPLISRAGARRSNT